MVEGMQAASLKLEAFALQTLALELARPAHRFGLLPRLALGGLFVGLAELHFTEDAFALHLLLQGLERLIDVVVADDDLNQGRLLFLGQWKNAGAHEGSA